MNITEYVISSTTQAYKTLFVSLHEKKTKTKNQLLANNLSIIDKAQREKDKWGFKIVFL